MKYISTKLDPVDSDNHAGEGRQGGGILCFLPGEDDIRKLTQKITRDPFFTRESFSVLTLHGSLPIQKQKAVFQKSSPGMRKIVVATNIAETSITVEDVVYVLDFGRVKQIEFDPEMDLARLEKTWISHASAEQRAGRAGRVRPGYCFRLYSSLMWNHKMPKHTVPEIQRTSLDDQVLGIAYLGLAKPSLHAFLGRLLSPPPADAITRAIINLERLDLFEVRYDRSQSPDIIIEEVKVSPIGLLVARLPVSVRIGKLLIMSSMFGCTEAALTIAAIASSDKPVRLRSGPSCKAEAFDEKGERKPDRLSQEEKAVAEAKKAHFSDFLGLVDCFETWGQLHTKEQKKAYCNFQGLDSSVLQRVSDLRKKFQWDMKAVVAQDVDQDPDSVFSSLWPSMSSDDPSKFVVLKAVICSAFFPRVCLKATGDHVEGLTNGRDVLRTGGGSVVHIHRSSINFAAGNGRPVFAGSAGGPALLVYGKRLKTSQDYIMETTAVTPCMTLLFGNPVHASIEKGIVVVDGWLRWNVSSAFIKVFKMVRLQLKTAIAAKLAEMGRCKGQIKHQSRPLVFSAIVKMLMMEV